MAPKDAKLFLHILTKLSNEKKWLIDEPLSQLSKETGLVINTVRKALDKLVEIGILTQEKPDKRNTPMIYQVNPPLPYSSEKSYAKALPGPIIEKCPALPLKEKIRALLFSISGKKNTISLEKIVNMLGAPSGEILTAFTELQKENAGKSVVVHELASGYVMIARDEYGRILPGKKQEPPPLTENELEVLAVICFENTENGIVPRRAPISKRDIKKIRGKDAPRTFQSLFRKNYIKIKIDPDAETFLYSPSKEFIDYCGKKNLYQILLDLNLSRKDQSCPIAVIEASNNCLRPGMSSLE